MAATTDLHIGQTVEWYDIPIGGCATGTIESVSHRTGWVTVRLNAPYTLAPRNDGSGALAHEDVTHITMRARDLTPRD
ncbi:hypothetical protein [Sinomonas sp. ASV322]|uniref:hypothetical protein n=1 Tax=Sinomonas sp. ASV322 TaxID=3041920 RepID=UPI0027DAF8CA|nr:hypothetical protein [Sinomonas sp. ASV322]MDQ4504413.1 hypothetical protein [Sinomonas sp. ASV322]